MGSSRQHGIFLSAFLDEEDLICLAESVEAIPIQK